MIDVHAHAFHRPFLENLARRGMLGVEARDDGFGFAGYGTLDPLLFDLEGRIESLARRGIELQLVSPPPRVVSCDGWAADAVFARELNAQTAALVRDGGSRVAGLAVPALTEPDKALGEVRRAMDEDGLVGVALPTTAAGMPLDGGPFESLFAECARRHCPVFMHPTTALDRPALGSYTMLQAIGWPTETALAVGRLIFDGVWERHPDFCMILAHGGGALPSLVGRLDLAYDARRYERNPACRAHITRRPSLYLRHILFDTCVAHPSALRALLDLVGPENVTFGSDFPFEVGDPEGAIALPVLDALPPAEREMIVAGTMRSLLKRV
ncbi:MAG: amidohydrolase family protein [Acetobacteraceae bacterium]